LTGSAVGDVCMWKTNTGNRMDCFTHREPPCLIVRAIAATYDLKANIGRFATGTSETGNRTFVKLWETVELRPRPLAYERFQ